MPENSRHQGWVVVVALLLAAAMTYYHLGVFLPHSREQGAAKGLGGGYSFGNDFYPVWLTSREALRRHVSPYAPGMTREIQTGLFGRPLDRRNPQDPPSNYRVFAYPAYVDLLFWPLSLVPFPVVRIVLVLLLAGLTSLSIPLWLRALCLQASSPGMAIVLLFTMSSYAVLEGLFAGQVGLIVGFLLAASFAALAEGKFFLSGSLLAFTLMKPQISVVVTAYLLVWSVSKWRERRRFAQAFFAWSAALIGLSLLVWPTWIRDWLRVLSGYGGYSPPALITYSLGPRLGPRVGPSLVVVLLVAALLLIWRMRKVAVDGPEFMATASLLLALTSITLLPGQAVYDHVVLLPGILLTAWKWRQVAASSMAFGVVLAAGALALFWQWIVVAPMLACRWLLTPPQFFASGLYLLPFHAAASVPLAVAALTGYAMRATMRAEIAPANKSLIRS